MKRALLLGVLLLMIMLVAGCAAGPNGFEDQADGNGDLAGFWMGLWHGFIIFFSFIISLFNDAVQVYEVHNTGGWYNFGFLLGASAFFGGGGKASCKR
ncbi:hypothetical protein KQI63_16535 [bacterium]|nr:hypothetical protein [bacterium]